MAERNLLRDVDFGNEAGDDVTPTELAEYFVEQSLINEFLDYKNRLMVATGKKGIGKSALIQWLRYKLPKIRKDILIVSCRGAELSRVLMGRTSELITPNDHIQDWMSRICTIVNRELAKKLRLALADDAITMVEAAELEGYKERNLVRSLVQRFTSIIPKLNAEPQVIKNEVEILKRAKSRPVWILIDDLDATFQNTNEECLALSTFFTACRYLTRDLESVNIRVTMRTDVWPVIRRYDEALDKVDQYVRPLLWTETEYRSLLARRIHFEMNRLHIPVGEDTLAKKQPGKDLDLISRAFVSRIPWGGESRNIPTHKVIYTLSYGRPRWAIQLCKLAKNDAIKRNDLKIGKDNVNNIWGVYGLKRIADIVSEHKHQCPEVEELINSFRGAPRLFSRDELLKWITNHISTHLNPVIEGERNVSNTDIAHFLFRIGFLQARSQESGGNYEHYDFDQMPDFFSSRTNADFNVLWEIHPCYRESLNIEKLNRSQRIQKGLIRGQRK